jgi:hypothetical protein
LTIKYTQQYRPVSNAETQLTTNIAELSNVGVSTEAPMSVRLVADTGYNANNTLKHVFNFKLVSELFMPHLTSVLGSTEEEPILYLGGFTIPHSHPVLRWWINGQVIAGAGTTSWILYSSAEPHFRASPMNSDIYATWGTSRARSYIDVWSGAWWLDTTTHTTDSRAGIGDVVQYFLLCAQNSDGTTQSKLATLDIQLQHPFTIGTAPGYGGIE